MTKRSWSRIAASAIGVAALAALVRAQALPAVGVPEAEAREQTVQSIFGSSLPWVGQAVFRAAPPAKRTALVQGAVAWAKAFTQSPAFKTAYDTIRDRERPQAPKAMAAADAQKQRAEFEEHAADIRKGMAGQPPETQKALEDAIKQMQAQMDKAANDPAMVKAMKDASAAQATAQREQYAKDLRAFDEKHPADPQAAVAGVLQAFLAKCADVDYDAKLKSVGGTMVFVNPANEQKSSEWKMCYRAGKEPMTAARTAVQAWLKELGR